MGQVQATGAPQAYYNCTGNDLLYLCNAQNTAVSQPIYSCIQLSGEPGHWFCQAPQLPAGVCQLNNSGNMFCAMQNNTGPGPTVTSFTPTSGEIGTSVTFSGTLLNNVVKITDMKGTNVSFTASADGTRITASVPEHFQEGPFALFWSSNLSGLIVTEPFTVTTSKVPYWIFLLAIVFIILLILWLYWRQR